MSRCPITYEKTNNADYSVKGLRKLSRYLDKLDPLPYTAKEQRREAARRAGKMSVQGMQPKLSAVLNARAGRFEVVDKGGRYILKPAQEVYSEVPENEDLTMRLAAAAGLKTPLHGLLYTSDETLTYFIKRFDRSGHNRKHAVEDFAQLSGDSRKTKYYSSMERIAAVVDEHCTFPAVEKVKLFQLTLFSYLIGNEDMHLKNFSLITRDGKIELSPAYDLLNTTILLSNSQDELALPLNGKKRHLTKKDFLVYFGRERLGLNDAVVELTMAELQKTFPEWERLIEISFLSDEMKDAYRALVRKRIQVIFS
jgi:serine/threonine-protein kinase HipA